MSDDLERLDFNDPDIRDMVRRRHDPLEVRNGTNQLQGVVCDACWNSWPCAAIVKLREVEQR